MSAVALDPLAAIDAAGEGRFEFADGQLIEMPLPPTTISAEAPSSPRFWSTSARSGGGLVVGDGFAQRLDTGTVRSPDVAYFRPEGLARVRPSFSEGGADLVVEIVSLDSQARDRGEKSVEYERAGVEEYWIVDPIRRNADFYRLAEGVYRPVQPDAEGRVHSSVLPGFFIRVAWLWDRPTLNVAQRELGLL